MGHAARPPQGRSLHARLRVGASTSPALVLRWEGENNAVPEALELVAGDDGRWMSKDPDGRVLELVPTIGQ